MNLAEIVVITTLVQYIFPKKWMDSKIEFTSYYIAATVITFGVIFIDVLNCFEEDFKGSLLKQSILMNNFLWMVLQGDILEDFIFRDMGCYGGVWHNWGWFVSWIPITTFAYFLNFYTLGQEAFLRHPAGVIEALNLGLNPFVTWRIDLKEKVTRQEDCVLMAFICFILTIH